MNQLAIHPFSAVFPEASPEEYQQLKASIDKRGQIEPIVLHGGEVLDGRTRYQVCRELKIPPQFRQYDPVKDGADALQWVIDKNLNRRHLTVGQRAALAVELTKAAAAWKAKQAEDAKANPNPTPNGPAEDPDEDIPITTKEKPMTQEEAAKAVGVSSKSVSEATNLAKNDPERFGAVKSGKTSLHEASEAAKQDKQPAAGLLEKTTATIPNQYRTECADMMAASHGDKFAEAVRNDTILKDQELRTFMKLPIQDQKQIAPMVARGWKTREAVKFAKGIFMKDDPIRDLLNLAIMRDGKAATKLDGHTILILSDHVLAEAAGEFVAAMIEGILTNQAKPESAKEPVAGGLAEAFKKAEEGPKGMKGMKHAPKKQPGGAPTATGKPSAPEPSSDGSKDATPKAAKSKQFPGSDPAKAGKPAAKKAAKKTAK